MVTYSIWYSDSDVQIIPVGEEHVHHMDIMCDCKPQYKMHGKKVTEVMHKSFVGNDYPEGYVFHPIMQKYDC